MFFVLLLVLCAGCIDGAKEGEVCIHNNISGRCVKITHCPFILEDPVVRKFAPACQTRGLVDVVCCNPPASVQEQCDPLPDYMTARRTGRRAWDKCIEYQQLMYPCRDGVRERRCPHESVRPLNLGSDTHATRDEFPHAVLLGYTNVNKQLDWLCGGTLVSERFVLTAAHCLASRTSGPASHVAVHPADRADVDPASIYKVKTIRQHPEYRPPRTYHDVALLELERVPLSSTTVPACLLLQGGPLPTDSEDEPTVIATSWNTNDILATRITWLRKIHLTRYPIEECSRLYPESRRGGYNDTTQTCYGLHEQNRITDICQDDGGSAIVVENKRLSCMYSVVGVTSYGRGCFTHSPGVYTRLSYYLQWIEDIVWP